MDNDIVKRLSKFSFVMSIIGVCTLGICPAFAMMGIAVPLVFKIKGVKPTAETRKKNKTAVILGIISLVLFVADIIVAAQFIK